MKISEILRQLGATVHVTAGLDRDVKVGVVGDLLSFIMGSAPEGAAWVTIQNHANVAAVAVLKEIPLVLLASGRTPLPELEEHCAREGIALASTVLDAFELCGRLYEMGLCGSRRS
ncbi:MAG TPA: serine kinase [Synergistaceae bacterium]|jgi:hypothetical protein|nr:MAG: HPr kinase [Synergistales bacterium 53_16]KUL02585.1 MAG: HPr kinase [Synergistales bacterium 54_9]MDN5335429.1 hypothetical protein [Synergistales bacterium]HAA47149.1 serine kinase [Synergistaceae bacterium]HAG23067.1 serine kinase [Synergistaceae bacterium]